MTDASDALLGAMPDLPVAEVIQALTSAYRGKGTAYSLRQVSRLVSATNDMAVYRTLVALTGLSAPLLAIEWEYCDERGEVFSIDAVQIRRAEEMGFLPHPRTLEKDHGWEKAVGQYFVPTEHFHQLVQA